MMAQLIKHQALAANPWQTLTLAEGETPETVALPAGDVIFPLAVWLARKNEIVSCHKRIGLLLEGDDAFEQIIDDLHYFIVVAINFRKFVDGRGYSVASLLRQRHGYAGELRAVGDILHDQLFYLKRVGFDAYVLKDGKNAVHAIENAFSTFSDVYQASTDQPEPAFRRHTA